jgi:hypothetical protein
LDKLFSLLLLCYEWKKNLEITRGKLPWTQIICCKASTDMLHRKQEWVSQVINILHIVVVKWRNLQSHEWILRLDLRGSFWGYFMEVVDFISKETDRLNLIFPPLYTASKKYMWFIGRRNRAKFSRFTHRCRSRTSHMYFTHRCRSWFKCLKIRYKGGKFLKKFLTLLLSKFK